MRLREFAIRFANLHQDEFWEYFAHPFLLEDLAFLEHLSERRVFLVRGSKGKPLLVGRGARCHIPVRSNLVSTRHAELRPPSTDDGPWELVDLGSTNSTFINGREVQPNEPVRLEDGMAIGFGPGARFLFLTGKSFYEQLQAMPLESSGSREDHQTEVISIAPGQTVRVGVSEGSQLADTPSEQSCPQPLPSELLLFCDPLDPVSLPIGQKLVCGRKVETADVVLGHKHVSRRHAEFHRLPAGVFVRDMGSANGTTVEDYGRLSEEWSPLMIGARVVIGPFTLFVDGPQTSKADELSSTMRVEIGSPEGIEGDLADLPLSKLLEEIEERGDSGVMEIKGALMKGRLGFKGGFPYSAETADGRTGSSAILRLLQETRGTYLLNPRADVGDREISLSFSEILLQRG